MLIYTLLNIFNQTNTSITCYYQISHDNEYTSHFFAEFGDRPSFWMFCDHVTPTGSCDGSRKMSLVVSEMLLNLCVGIGTYSSLLINYPREILM